MFATGYFREFAEVAKLRAHRISGFAVY